MEGEFELASSAHGEDGATIPPAEADQLQQWHEQLCSMRSGFTSELRRCSKAEPPSTHTKNEADELKRECEQLTAELAARQSEASLLQTELAEWQQESMEMH